MKRCIEPVVTAAYGIQKSSKYFYNVSPMDNTDGMVRPGIILKSL